MLIGTLYPLVLEVADRRAHLGRRAVLQPDLRPADRAAPAHRAVRADARLEARRPPRRRGAAGLRLRRWPFSRRWSRPGWPAAENLLALFGVGGRHLADRRRDLRDRVSHQARSPRRRPRSLRRLAGLPRSAFGTTLAHAGVGVTVLGIVVASNFATEHILTMRPGDEVVAGGRTIVLDDVFTARRTELRRDGRPVHGARGGQRGRGDGADQAPVRGAPDGDHRGGDRDLRRLAALRVARRHRARQGAWWSASTGSRWSP